MLTPLRHGYLYLTARDLDIEWRQCQEEGKEVQGLAEEFQRVKALDLDDPSNQPAAQAFLDATAALPLRADYPYREPSDWEGIQAERGEAPTLPSLRLSDAELEDKVYGAWLGRVCGCLLGKPVEGWRRSRMWGYLRDAGRWPLADYFSLSVPEEVRQRYDVRPERPFIETVRFMPEDDDTNYTTLGLVLLKRYGPAFTPYDVATLWMSHLPILHTYTAERVAYRNLCLLIPPPRSASFRNPFREWIGAQIRADFFGYVAPGRPERAAEFAWRDGCLSHVKNGIYGEMWVAAMLAAAFVCEDVPTLLEAGLAQIPTRSRLQEAIRQVMAWHAEGVEYEEAVERVHQRWDETHPHHWCHVISNAMVVAIGLLWGGLDYERSICRAVQACFDTDCNGATVGSIVGAVLGARNLPRKWTEPVHDTLQTGVAGYGMVRISDLARETLGLIEKGLGS